MSFKGKRKLRDNFGENLCLTLNMVVAKDSLLPFLYRGIFGIKMESFCILDYYQTFSLMFFFGKIIFTFSICVFFRKRF